MPEPRPELPPQALAFRNGMSRLGAAVNLVTTDGPAGRHGMTVSAVCSVTDTPPMLMVCLNTNAFAHDAFLKNGVIGVNVLGEHHQELSKAFARWTGEDRFTGDGWRVGASGVPLLRDATVAFDCNILDRTERGTHSVLFCEVIETTVTDSQTSSLIWFDRGFHGLTARA